MIEVIDEQLPVLDNDDKTIKVPQVLLKFGKLGKTNLVEFLPKILTFSFVVESVFHLTVMSNKISNKTSGIKKSANVSHKSTFKDINRLAGLDLEVKEYSSGVLSTPTHS